MLKKKDIWKPVVKYYYSRQRKEHKYHTDFRLKEGQSIEDFDELMKVLKKKTPKGKTYQIHFEMAVEEEPQEEETIKQIKRLKRVVKFPKPRSKKNKVWKKVCQ